MLKYICQHRENGKMKPIMKQSFTAVRCKDLVFCGHVFVELSKSSSHDWFFLAFCLYYENLKHDNSNPDLISTGSAEAHVRYGGTKLRWRVGDISCTAATTTFVRIGCN